MTFGARSARARDAPSPVPVFSKPSFPRTAPEAGLSAKWSAVTAATSGKRVKTSDRNVRIASVISPRPQKRRSSMKETDRSAPKPTAPITTRDGYYVVSFAAPSDLYKSSVPAYDKLLKTLRLYKRKRDARNK